MDTGSDPETVAASDLDPVEHDHGKRTFDQYRLAHAAGGEDLGASLYELAAGNRTWPAHYHAGNEEAVYVLEGRLRLWLGPADGREEFLLEPGDYAACPTGPGYVRELEAAERARFLVVSTMYEPDVTVLPDRATAHLVAGDPPGEYEGRYLSKTLDLDAEVAYWMDGAVDDEPDDGDAATDGGPVGDRVVSSGDLAWTDHDHGDHRFRRKQLGAAAGGRQLGTSLYELPAGKHAWLAHYHAGNEEALYVLEGGGTVTVGPDRREYALEPGDYAALPAGEAGYHDVVAGDDGLRYLMISTMDEPDVTVYPDHGKVGLYAGSAPGGDRDERTLSTYLDAGAERDYWE